MIDIRGKTKKYGAKTTKPVPGPNSKTGFKPLKGMNEEGGKPTGKESHTKISQREVS